MSDSVVENLTIDFLQWLVRRERTYEEAISAWRTSCPRLPVWEDAHDRGFVRREEVDRSYLIKVTPAGLAFLQERRCQKSAESLEV